MKNRRSTFEMELERVFSWFTTVGVGTQVTVKNAVGVASQTFFNLKERRNACVKEKRRSKMGSIGESESLIRKRMFEQHIQYEPVKPKKRVSFSTIVRFDDGGAQLTVEKRKCRKCRVSFTIPIENDLKLCFRCRCGY